MIDKRESLFSIFANILQFTYVKLAALVILEIIISVNLVFGDVNEFI
jgi:hypothetical protein